jgi:hypothetical protein
VVPEDETILVSGILFHGPFDEIIQDLKIVW